MSAPHPEHRRAVVGLLLANLFWGLSFPLLKAMGHAQRALEPESSSWFIAALTVAWRFLLASVVLVPLVGRQVATATRGELRQGVVLGFTLGAGILLQVDGLMFTPASTSAFLTQFYAILIPLVVAVRARRRPPAAVWGAVALVLAGVAILGRFDFRAMRLGRGEVETLLSSLFFMLQIFELGSRRYAGNRTLVVTAVMFVTVGVTFAGLVLAIAPEPAACLRPWSSGPWVVFLALLTLFCTLGSFILMNRWQPLMSATEAGLLYCFEPVFAAVMALFLPGLFSRWAGFDYPNETLTWQLLVGGGLITAANVWLQLKPPPRAA